MSKRQAWAHMRQVFSHAVSAVQASNIFSDYDNFDLRPQMNRNSMSVKISGIPYDISRKKCHIVGFGKGVLGMAVKVHEDLGNASSGGIISVPVGAVEQFKKLQNRDISTQLTVYEGAANNLPCPNAQAAAKDILSLANNMTYDDVLFVLITGGGSALLPLPKPPLTLNDKRTITESLMKRGASIQEINTVRIACSDIKGGKLACAANKASLVVTFVISDIIGDPLELIASGPTCLPSENKYSAADVLRKYDVWKDLSAPVQAAITAPETDSACQTSCAFNPIFIVGSNVKAMSAAATKAKELGYIPCLLSDKVQGDVHEVAHKYESLLQSISEYKKRLISEDELRQRYPYEELSFPDFLTALKEQIKTEMPLFLIFGGEPVIKVSGNGLGGRSQHLALLMSHVLHRNNSISECSFLSAGTDGIDGPTDAAGAIGDSRVIRDYFQCHSIGDLEKSKKNCDSYNFFAHLSNGLFHIVTGHTGTNVMDLHFIVVPFEQQQPGT